MKWISRFAVAVVVMVATAFGARASDLETQRELLSKAQFTLERFQKDPKMATARSLAKYAEGIVIFPTLVKGALFVGGEGGNGILLAKRKDGSWSYPAFYSLASISFGLQVGGQSSEALLLVMTRDGLEALMADQAKLGGDVSAAAGPVGTGVEASSSTAVDTDVYTYSSTKGLFIGASLEGAVLARREDLNGDFYGGIVNPQAIVLHGEGTNILADPLRNDVARFTAK